MVIYHILWDVSDAFGVEFGFLSTIPGEIWHHGIGFGFIALSGFCWSLGTRHFKRGITVLLAGELVSLVTLLIMPDFPVHFGVLTLIGSCMLVMIALDKVYSGTVEKIGQPAHSSQSSSQTIYLKNAPFSIQNTVTQNVVNTLLLIISLVLFGGLFDAQTGLFFGMELPKSWFVNSFTAYLGFPAQDFISSDYYPLIPWIFVFLSGYLAYKILSKNYENRVMENLEPKSKSICGKSLEWMGRYSLEIYLIHQVVIFGLVQAAYYVIKGL